MSDDHRVQASLAHRCKIQLPDVRLTLRRLSNRQEWTHVAPSEETRRRLEQKGLVREAIAFGIESDSADPQVRERQQVTLEQVIGRDDIVSVVFLERGSVAAQSVGRIVRGPSRRIDGTGFLVSPDLLLTNCHILEYERDAANHIVQFDFVDRGRQAVQPVEFRMNPDRFFIKSPIEELDFALVAIEQVNAKGENLSDFGWLPLRPAFSGIQRGEAINIVHHPEGAPKRVSFRDNLLVLDPDNFLSYLTDTEGGSSGAPLFNDDWEVVGLHRASRAVDDPEAEELFREALREISGRTLAADEEVRFNEGVKLTPIVVEIARQAASLDPGRQALAEAAITEGGLRPAAPLRTSRQSVDPTQPPVNIHFTFGGGRSPLVNTATSGIASLGDSGLELFRNDPGTERSLLRGLEALFAARGEAYLPEVEERDRRLNEYYDGVRILVEDPATTPAAAFAAVSSLVSDFEIAGEFPTGLESLSLEASASYDRARAHLYTRVDLQPDGILRGVYTNARIAPELLMLRDLIRAVGQEDLLPTEIRNDQTLNTEHIVPRSYFGNARIPESDLHHLITAYPPANNFRSNHAFRQLGDAGEPGPANRRRGLPAAGRRNRDDSTFEPAQGRGIVARATLYFLLAHPGQIGRDRYDEAAVEVLKGWARDEPPQVYEHHRNEMIFEVQENRNPLIDFPAWIDHIDFAQGLG